MPRWLSFLVFFTLFLTVWGSANYYVFRRGWQALREHPRLGQRRWRRAYIGLALFLSTAYLAAHALGYLEFIVGRAAFETLVWIGSIWLGFATYLLFVCLGIDLVRLGDRCFGYFPAGWKAPQIRARVRLRTAAVAFAVVSLATIAGFVNALTPVTRTVRVTLDKPFKRGALRIAMASDIHLGAVVGAGRLRKIVAAVNAQQADLVLLPGDVVDEPLRPDSHPEICRLLKSLRSRLGVYGCTGNHEYIVGEKRSVAFLEACGVSMLRDRAVKLDDGFGSVHGVSEKPAAAARSGPSAPAGPARMVLVVPDEPARGRKPALSDGSAAVVSASTDPPERLHGFYLAGREDYSRRRMVAGAGRAALPDILSGLDRSLPVILMDHTPVRLQEAEQAGVDLQLSGHTHHAQLWPLNYITQMIYEKDWGYLRRGATQYYVSCGAGTWGPPLRTNSRSEVVVIEVSFRKVR